MTTRGRMVVKTGEDSTEAGLEERFTIHLLSILAQSEEREEGNSDCDLDPTIENDGPACWEKCYVPPLGTMYFSPTVRKHGHDGIPV